jgi:SAM-dependent methyltransferase
MPKYKYIGNRILTTFENIILGQHLTEYHSGYRLYGTQFLSKVRYQLNTDDFHFDTQIIIQAHMLDEKVVEVPIPTYYGDEICHVNGMKYAADVVGSVLDYRLHQLGVTRRERYIPVSPVQYTLKDFAYSSHRLILDSIRPGDRVLDLGCGTGLLAERIAAKGCDVTGVDVLPPEMIQPSIHYVRQNLEDPGDLPFEREFDCVVLGDIIEHVVDATGLMMRIRRVLKGNIALWVYRIALLLGRFDYTDKGILDRTHVHLYTQASLRDLLNSLGFRVLKERGTSIPFPLVITVPLLRWLAHGLNHVYGWLAWVWPRLFAYQFVFTGEIRRIEWTEMRKLPAQYQQPHPHLQQELTSAAPK